jgi:hypothetical protein
MDGGQRRAQSAPPRTLQRCDVVDAAIAGEIESHRSRDVLAAEASDEDVVGGLIRPAEEARRHAEDPEVFEPVWRAELDIGPR